MLKSKKIFAPIITLGLLILIMMSTFSNIPYTLVEASDLEYDAFINTGRTFFEKYIENKYISTSAQRGGVEKVFTLDSVYAFEYAINKDFLEDDTIVKLTTGDTKIVELKEYAEKVNVFCAEALTWVPEARQSTNAPNDKFYSPDSQSEEEREWAVEGRGIPTPDFSELAFKGKESFGCESFLDYITHYAVMDKNALWDGNWGPTGLSENEDGNLIIGWVKLPDGDITVQEAYQFDISHLCNLYNTSGYGFVISNDRYYLLNENILQQNETELNFAKDMILTDRGWYDTAEPEDKTIKWIPDSCYGVNSQLLPEMIGEANYTYINISEIMPNQKAFVAFDISCPIERDDEYTKIIRLQAADESKEVTINCLSETELFVRVLDDTDGWYSDQMYFTSSDERVATVDNRGHVYGISEGTAMITVTVKTSGRVRPVEIPVHVTDSPAISRQMSIGFATEDSVYMGSEVTLDSLTKMMINDNASSVIINEQPIFTLNGSRDYDTEKPISEGDVLKLERWTQSQACGTMPFEEYKRLSDKLHNEGKKLYISLQSWMGAYGGSPSSYSKQMIFRYIEDPDDVEANKFIDKLFSAMEDYLTTYAESYTKAGVDGIFITDFGGAVGFHTLFINDGHYSKLISAVKKVYSGKIMVYYDYKSDLLEASLNNHDLFDNVDSILVIAPDNLQDYFSSNPSIEECKELFSEEFGQYLDKLYQEYHKPIDTEWWISSTKTPVSFRGDGSGGRGIWIYPSADYTYNKTTTTDYLQQMITWEAILEFMSEKGYAGTVYERYKFMADKVSNSNDDIRDGMDCDPSVHKKPASKLAAVWGTGTEIGMGTHDIKQIEGNALNEDYYSMQIGDTALLTMKQDFSVYKFTSSDNNVISVDETGVMTANGIGKALITIIDTTDTSSSCLLTVFVLPGGTEYIDELFESVKAFATCFDKNDAMSFGLLYELAVRINEHVLSQDVISSLVDGGIFDLNSPREYAEFVSGLADYGDRITLNDLKIEANNACKCISNDEYIFEYVVKNPMDGNLFTEGQWHDVHNNPDNPDEVVSEHLFDDGTRLFGWWYGDDGAAYVQYFSSKGVPCLDFYFSNMIYTGNRFYFTNDWKICKDNVTLIVNDTNITLQLEDDGGISDKELRKAFGEEEYENLMDIIDTGRTDFFYRDPEDRWFFPVRLNSGYPVKEILDFTCDDLEYDGKTALSPIVICNYSQGEVVFSYKLSGKDEWTDIAPTAPGTYVVRASSAPNNGYRKTICEKTVRIKDTSKTEPHYETVGKAGDINGDGDINSKDATVLRRYLAGGWNVEIVSENSDVNNDSQINSKDVTVLRRYLAGGWGITL